MCRIGCTATLRASRRMRRAHAGTTLLPFRLTHQMMTASTAIAAATFRRRATASDRESTGSPCAPPSARGIPPCAREASAPRRECFRARCHRRVVKIDAARQMHPKRDELSAGPADVADLQPRGRSDFLHEAELLLEPIEPIPRPRQRRKPRQLRDVAHLDPHVHETPAVPPERADLANGYSRALRRAGGMPVDRTAPPGSTSSVAPRKATSAGIDALMSTTAEPSSDNSTRSSYSYCLTMPSF